MPILYPQRDDGNARRRLIRITPPHGPISYLLDITTHHVDGIRYTHEHPHPLCTTYAPFDLLCPLTSTSVILIPLLTASILFIFLLLI
jgi:hypothetical protein